MKQTNTAIEEKVKHHMAELMFERAQEQRRQIEAIAARVDTIAASLKTVQDDLADLLAS